MNWSKITKNIFLGSILDLNDEVDGILCLTTFKKDPPVGPKFHHLVLEDTAEFPIAKYFPETFNIIDEYVKNNKKIFVCCTAGISRSPTIVIAYLMQKNKWDYDRAYEFVAERRGRISPNIGFQIALENF